jgi:NADH-quinone oxidoreductase subunit N
VENSLLTVPWPVVALAAGGVVLLGLGPKLGGGTAPGLFGLLVLLGACACAGFQPDTSGATHDVITQASIWGTLLVGMLFVLVSLRPPCLRLCDARDYGLALVALAGAMAAGAAQSLTVAVAGLHLAALGMHAFAWRRHGSAMRPAVLSAWLFHSACLLLVLLGLMMLYGLGGSLWFEEIAAAGRGRFVSPEFAPLPRSIAVVATVGLLTGLCGFAVMHSVHGGRSRLLETADTSAACLLLPLPPWTAMLVVLRLVPDVLGSWSESAVTVTVLSAWLLILSGGVLSLGQRRILPLLACALMAHFGLWLVGAAVGAWEATDPGKGLWPSSGLPGGAAAALLSLCADGLALLGLLTALATLRRGDSPAEFIEDVAGLLRQRPVTGVGAAVCIASLCGVPPLPGFWGRWWLFVAAFGPQQPSSLTGLYEPHYGFLATCGMMIIGSVIIAGAYLRLFQQVVLEEPRGRLEAAGLPISRWCAGLLAAAVLVAGWWPQPLLQSAARGFPPPPGPQVAPGAPEQTHPERNTEPDGTPGPRQSARASGDGAVLIDGYGTG